MLVEGFETKWLRDMAIALGRDPDRKFQSLKLIEECLMGLGFAEADARNVTAPMHKLHFLRSKLKGHAPGDEVPAIRREILAVNGGYGSNT